ncbi:hypothetical protein HanRHA438_Chr08g0328541 [Helianthus annuus]|nr:hypothetical protein HanRHA438_Chr08g0328541 [Helianthus annuus]
MPSYCKKINLITKQNRIKNTPRELACPPTVQLAKILHRHVFVIIMWDFVERFRWFFPQWA